MKTTLKHLSDTTIELTITLDASDLTAAKHVALTKLSNTVKVPGFRKGKVPASMVEKHVDPHALDDQTLQDALSKAVADAFLGEKLQALDRPAVEIKKYVPGTELEFTAEAQIIPKITLGDYKKLKVKQEKITVSDEEVEEMINRLREGMGEKIEVMREAQLGDEAVIDFIGMKNGVAFDGGTGKDYSLKLGSNSFIPGFEEGIVGKKPGETFDLDLRFPETYHVSDLAGAKVVFTTTLNKVHETSLPKVDDAFAKKVGEHIKTVKELKDDIKKELLAQKEREAGEKLKDELVRALVAASKVPTPQILIDDQKQSIEQDMNRNLMYQNITLDQYIANQGFKDKDDWEKNEVMPAAEKRVQAGLVLSELSKVEKITATKEELENHINLYKQQYSNNPEALKQFDEPEVQRDIANRLLTEKTVDLLVQLNT
jgi:trigger factor